jgi:hypothetical protein
VTVACAGWQREPHRRVGLRRGGANIRRPATQQSRSGSCAHEEISPGQHAGYIT